MRVSPLFALLLLLVSSRAQAQSCELAGTIPVAHVSVTPAGGAPLDLDIERMPLAITAGPPGAHLAIRTTGALSLQGTVATSEVSLGFARPTRLAGGVLRAGRSTRVISFVGDGADVRVDLELEDGVTVGIVAAPCASLRLAARGPRRAAGSSRGQLVAAAGELAFSATAGGATELTVHLADPAGVRLQKLGTRNGYVHVRARLAYAELDGWVQAAAVQPVSHLLRAWHAEPGTMGQLMRQVCNEAHEGVYVGPATLSPGAEITDREGHVWARTVGTLAVRVARAPGASRARIEAIPGVFDHEGCEGFLDRGFVASSSVVLPPGVVR